MSSPTGPRPTVQLPDGTPYFGRLGEVAYDPDEDKAQCQLCGEWFRQVGDNRLTLISGTAGRLRTTGAFRLPQRISTCADGLTALEIQLAARQAFGTPGRLKGDPAAARAAGSAPRRAIPQTRRSFANTSPDLLVEWHATRNAGLRPTALGMAWPERVWWRCTVCGHEWRATIAARRRGIGCPCCLRERQRHRPQLREANAH